MSLIAMDLRGQLEGNMLSQIGSCGNVTDLTLSFNNLSGNHRSWVPCAFADSRLGS